MNCCSRGMVYWSHVRQDGKRFYENYWNFFLFIFLFFQTLPLTSLWPHQWIPFWNLFYQVPLSCDLHVHNWTHPQRGPPISSMHTRGYHTHSCHAHLPHHCDSIVCHIYVIMDFSTMCLWHVVRLPWLHWLIVNVISGHDQWGGYSMAKPSGLGTCVAQFVTESAHQLYQSEVMENVIENVKVWHLI